MGYNLVDEQKNTPHRTHTGCTDHTRIGFRLRREQRSRCTYSYK